jgi:hypothetical protein
MSEPFVGERNIQSFISWARTSHWTKLTQADARSIKSGPELAKTLQKTYGWSDRDAKAQIERVAREWKRR